MNVIDRSYGTIPQCYHDYSRGIRREGQQRTRHLRQVRSGRAADRDLLSRRSQGTAELSAGVQALANPDTELCLAQESRDDSGQTIPTRQGYTLGYILSCMQEETIREKPIEKPFWPVWQEVLADS